MTTQLYPFYTYLILREFSSEAQPVNAAFVSKKLTATYLADEPRIVTHKDGTVTEEPRILNRQTIYAHFNLLEEMCTKYADQVSFQFFRTPDGVYIEPIISKGEAHLLSDAIATSRFIDKDSSSDMIEKLGMLANENLLNFFQPRLAFKNHLSKEYNDRIFENVTNLSAAIQASRKVKVRYMKYDIHKKLVPMWGEGEEGYRVICPYYLIWSLNKYYVMYTYEGKTTPRFLRVDKIDDLIELDDRVPAMTSISNLADYTRNQVFMFGGEAELIKFRCKMGIIGQVIDFFGEDVTITPIDDDYFRVELRTSKESIRYWLMQYISSVDQIQPKALAEDIHGMLVDALERNKI